MDILIYIISIACILVVFGTAVWAFIYWWKKDKTTRERFAFTGFWCLFTLVVSLLLSLTAGMSPITIIYNLFAESAGIDKIGLSYYESTLISVLIFIIAITYYKVLKNWQGAVSIAQDDERRNGYSYSFTNVLTYRLRAWVNPELNEKLDIVSGINSDDTFTLKKPQSIPWHKRAKDIFSMKYDQYVFDEEYNKAIGIWIAKDKMTDKKLVLVPLYETPDTKEKEKIISYANEIPSLKKGYEIKYIIDSPEEEDNNEEYIFHDSLISDLVNFSEYFRDIERDVERSYGEFSPSIKEIYTPSKVRIYYGMEANKCQSIYQSIFLEDEINEWLVSSDEKQIAILGDYGQGKSTSMKMLAYNLIKKYKLNKTVRIPIIIELRGQNLSSLKPESILQEWSRKYDIHINHIMQLHYSGKLLLVFEGFDEIDLNGGAEKRVKHFNSLWQFNCDNSKIIITGRQNFFLGETEQNRALGKANETLTFNLELFNKEQIVDSLRSFPDDVRLGIIEFYNRNDKFADLISRPSILHVVAKLWKHRNLASIDNLNSAIIMELFIDESIKRQRDKQDEIFSYMELNSSERLYFMAGIALYMLKLDLPNQINTEQLDDAINILISSIPESVSKNTSVVNETYRAPLRDEQRLNWTSDKRECIDRISNDVRACGLLVVDSQKNGCFKFSHKSYMEYLQAYAISTTFEFSSSNEFSSLINKLKISPNKYTQYVEVANYLCEIAVTSVKRTNDSGKSIGENLLKSMSIKTTSTNWIVERYENILFWYFKRKWAQMLFLMAPALYFYISYRLMGSINSYGNYFIWCVFLFCFSIFLTMFFYFFKLIRNADLVPPITIKMRVISAGAIAFLINYYMGDHMISIVANTSLADIESEDNIVLKGTDKLYFYLDTLACSAILFYSVYAFGMVLLHHMSDRFSLIRIRNDKIFLWYSACLDLGVDSSEIEKVVGNKLKSRLKMMVDSSDTL